MTKSYKTTKIACFIGFVVQAIINNFLPLLFIIFNTRYNLNYEQLGRLLFVNFFVQLIVDALTPALVKRIGYRGAAIACHGLAAAGLFMLGVLPLVFPNQIYACLVASIIVYASGSGIIEVCISPMVELLPMLLTYQKYQQSRYKHGKRLPPTVKRVGKRHICAFFVTRQ